MGCVLCNWKRTWLNYKQHDNWVNNMGIEQSFDNHFYYIHFMLCKIVLLKMTVDQCIDCVVGVMFLKFWLNWESFSTFEKKYSCRDALFSILYQVLSLWKNTNVIHLSIYIVSYCFISIWYAIYYISIAYYIHQNKVNINI